MDIKIGSAEFTTPSLTQNEPPKTEQIPPLEYAARLDRYREALLQIVARGDAASVEIALKALEQQ